MSMDVSWVRGRRNVCRPVAVLLCVGMLCSWMPTAVADLQFEEVKSFAAPTAYAPGLAMNGTGFGMLVWEGTSSSTGSDTDIFVATFVEGATGMGQWSTVKPINTGAATDTYSDCRVDFATDGLGVWIAAWETQNYPGHPTYDNDILYSKSTDNGATWSPPLPINKDAYNDGNKVNDWIVRLAVGRSQSGLPVWMARWNHTGTGTDLGARLARSVNSGGSWDELSPDVSLSIPCSTLAYGRDSQGAGRWLAVAPTQDSVWYMSMASSTDGWNWSAPSRFLADVTSLDTSTEGMPALVGTNSGTWLLVHGGRLSSTGKSIRLAMRSVGVDDWSTMYPLNANPALDPTRYDRSLRCSVATDGGYRWVAVWSTSGGLGGALGNDYDLVYAESSDDGVTWTMPLPVSASSYTDTTNEEYCRVIWSGASWVLAWVGGNALHVTRALPEPGIALVVQPTAGIYTTEGLGKATFLVRLASKPQASVDLTFESDGEGHVIEPFPSFTTENWATAQAFTVEGLDDADVDGDKVYHITLTAASESDYDGISESITLINRDNDDGAMVQSIVYALVNSKRDLQVCSTVVRASTGQPIDKAVVSGDVYREGVGKVASFNATTGVTGKAYYTLANAAKGKYTTTITNVVAGDLPWVGGTPANSYVK